MTDVHEGEGPWVCTHTVRLVQQAPAVTTTTTTTTVPEVATTAAPRRRRRAPSRRSKGTAGPGHVARDGSCPPLAGSGGVHPAGRRGVAASSVAPGWPRSTAEPRLSDDGDRHTGGRRRRVGGAVCAGAVPSMVVVVEIVVDVVVVAGTGRRGTCRTWCGTPGRPRTTPAPGGARSRRDRARATSSWGRSCRTDR